MRTFETRFIWKKKTYHGRTSYVWRTDTFAEDIDFHNLNKHKKLKMGVTF